MVSRNVQISPDLSAMGPSLPVKVIFKNERRTGHLQVPARDKEMLTTYTNHAAIRSQQRGIPPLVSDWLIDYGNEEFNGHGGVVRYFSTTGIRQLEGEIGKRPVQQMSEFLRCYLVQASGNGSIITVGKRHAKKHIWRH